MPPETTAKPLEKRPIFVTNRTITIHVSEESGERFVMWMLAIVQYFSLTLLQHSTFFYLYAQFSAGEIRKEMVKEVETPAVALKSH
jgi:hypothetical protein